MREKKRSLWGKSFFISKNRRNANRQNHTAGSLTFYKAHGEDSEEKAVQGQFLFFFFFVNLFIYLFRLCWVFVAARRLPLVGASRGYSSLRCVGFSLQWLPLLQSTGSRHVGFSICGMQAQ